MNTDAADQLFERDASPFRVFAWSMFRDRKGVDFLIHLVDGPIVICGRGQEAGEAMKQAVANLEQHRAKVKK